MAILATTELGDGSVYVIVDHDPRSATTNVRKGSLIVSTLAQLNGTKYTKLDDGATANVAAGGYSDIQPFLADAGPSIGYASGSYCETLPSGAAFPTSEIWYTSSGKTTKIIQLTITRDSNKKPTQEQYILYGSDGVTVISTVTDNISYQGAFETSRTRTIA